MNAIVSIIVPIYNVEKYLVQCIDSILAQTYRNLQIILVDDGSTDSSGKICDEYQQKDARILVVHQENKGLVAARKSGLKKAIGKYIGFVDGDDYVEPEMYSRLLTIMEKTESDVVHSGFFKNNNSTIWGTIKTEIYDMDDNNVDKMLRMLLSPKEVNVSISSSIWSKLYKREIIIESYSEVPEFQSYGEDLLCFCNAIFKSKRITIINEAYYHYIFREDSIVHKIKKDVVIREYGLYEQLLLNFEKNSKYEYYKEYAEKMLLYNLSFALKKVNQTGIRCYEYPDLEFVKDKNIVIYGAGMVGQDYYAQFSLYEKCNIVAWVDAAHESYSLEYYKIRPSEAIKLMNYDIIIIAVSNENLADEIVDVLENMGIDKKKIFWKTPLYAMNIRR